MKEEQEKEETEEEVRSELKKKREQLLAWKVHIYIQKSRKAQEEAEELLDTLLSEVNPLESSLYLPLKLQKQQFLIQKGEGKETLNKAKEEWECRGKLEYLHCYMSALLELERGKELLQLWKKEEVQKLVAEITDKTMPLWEIMFYGASIEKDLEFFLDYFTLFEKKASEEAVFQVEWILARLYNTLKMTKEKEEKKNQLLNMLEKLNVNEYIRINYLAKIKQL